MENKNGTLTDESFTRFNRRLSRKYRHLCRVSKVVLSEVPEEKSFDEEYQSHHQHQDGVCYRGGVKVHFKIKGSVVMRNTFKIDNLATEEHFNSDFVFPKKTVYVLPVCSHETVTDLVKKVYREFKIVKINPKSSAIVDPDDLELRVYEKTNEEKICKGRILRSESYYRQLDQDDKPLEMFVKSTNYKITAKNTILHTCFVVADHDLNAAKYGMMNDDQLEQELMKIDREEEELVSSVRKHYQDITDRLETYMKVKESE